MRSHSFLVALHRPQQDWWIQGFERKLWRGLVGNAICIDISSLRRGRSCGLNDRYPSESILGDLPMSSGKDRNVVDMDGSRQYQDQPRQVGNGSLHRLCAIADTASKTEGLCHIRCFVDGMSSMQWKFSLSLTWPLQRALQSKSVVDR